MAKFGARGKTEEEITRTLRYPADDNILGKRYSNILAALQVNSLLIKDKDDSLSVLVLFNLKL